MQTSVFFNSRNEIISLFSIVALRWAFHSKAHSRPWYLNIFNPKNKSHEWHNLIIFQIFHLKYLFCLFLFTLVCTCNDPPAYSVFTSKMQSRQTGISGKNMTKSTSISGDMCSLEKNDGSQSDTAVGALGSGGKKRRSSIGAKMVAIVGLSRKSRSASQLSQTGRHFHVTFDFIV